jgi:hypothetical protein
LQLAKRKLCTAGNFRKIKTEIACGKPFTSGYLLKGVKYLLEMLQKGIKYPLQSNASKQTTVPSASLQPDNWALLGSCFREADIF